MVTNAKTENSNKVLAKLDKDYINNGEYKAYNRVGLEWTERELRGITWFDYDDIDFEGAPVRFRCKDDDGETYYGGWLYNDGECILQQLVLAFATRDAGCTTIEVKDVNDRWCQEIG